MMANGNGINGDCIGQLPLFDRLDPATVASITAAGRIVNVPRHDLVLSRGDYLDGFFGVCEGSVKLYMLSPDGHERILRMLRHGDSFGEATMFNGLPSPVFAEALSDSNLAYIPRDAVTLAIHSDPEFSQSLFQCMSHLVHDLVHDIESCCMMSARQRTVVYLLRGCGQSQDGPHEVVLPASKSTIASMLNLTPETLSRELHHLQELGLIEICRRNIRIHDLTRLRALVESGTRTGRCN